MVEMCQFVGNRDQLITLLLPLVEHILNIIHIHFQDRYVSIHISSLPSFHGLRSSYFVFMVLNTLYL